MDSKIVKAAAFIIVGSVVVPIVAGGVVAVINGVAKIIHNRKIKKGLKDGSIVEIDGQYYEMKVEDAKEA